MQERRERVNRRGRVFLHTNDLPVILKLKVMECMQDINDAYASGLLFHVEWTKEELAEQARLRKWFIALVEQKIKIKGIKQPLCWDKYAEVYIPGTYMETAANHYNNYDAVTADRVVQQLSEGLEHSIKCQKRDAEWRASFEVVGE